MPTSTAPTRRPRPATADELLAPGIHRRDSTYAKVTTEHGRIGADEPVIVFRAKDSSSRRVLGLPRDDLGAALSEDLDVPRGRPGGGAHLRVGVEQVLGPV